MAALIWSQHCPPHVHVGSADWEARLEFSFWQGGMRLMDGVPSDREPTVAVLEALLCQVLKNLYICAAPADAGARPFRSVCLVHLQ